MKFISYPIAMILLLTAVGTMMPYTATLDAGGPSFSDTPSLTASPGSWPNLCGDPNHSGSTSSPGPSSSTLLWSNGTGTDTYSSPTVAEGKVFIGTQTGRVQAFDAYTGEQIFNQLLTGGDYGIGSTPAYSNGHIVVYCNGNDAIYRLNATNGAINWTFDTGASTYGGSSAVIANGTVWIGSSNRNFYCLDETSGTVQWSYQTGNGITRSYGVCSSPAVDDQNVYFGACDGYLYCFDRDSTGVNPPYLWRAFLTDSIFGSPMLHGDHVYCGVGVYNQGEGSVNCYKMFMLWKNNGTIEHSYTTGNHIMATPALYNNNIYFGSQDDHFYALDADDLSFKWSYQTGSDIVGSAALSGGMVYFASKDNKVYCLDADDGSFIWSYTTGDQCWSSCAIADGILYTASLDDNVYAFGYSDPIPPGVTSTYPSDDATSVPLGTSISATFNDSMKQSTLNTGTFIVKDPSQVAVTGTVSYNAATRTATFDPSSNLQQGTTYTVTLSASMTDYANNGLDGNYNGVIEGSPADDYTWDFTTTTSSTNLPPILSSPQVTPASGSIDDGYEYSVTYTDPDNDDVLTVGYVRIHIDGSTTGIPMTVNTSSEPSLHDGIFSNGEQFIHSTKLSTSGQHTYRIDAYDGADRVSTGAQDGPSITNFPPQFTSPLSSVNCQEDVDEVVDLSTRVFDPDTPIDEITITTNSSYATVSGLTITLCYDNDFTYDQRRTYEVVKVTLNDTHDEVFTNMEVSVAPVNDPPYIDTIGNVTAVEGVESTVDLEGLIGDIDDTKEDLLISTDSHHITVSKHRLGLLYTNGIVSEDINVTVTDPDGGNATTRFTVTVTPADDPPTISSIPKQVCTEDVPHILDLATYISDIDTATSSLVIAEDSKYAKLNGTSLQMLYPNGVLSENITVTVFDGTSSVDGFVLVEVTPVNDAPALSDPRVNEPFGDEDTLFTFSVEYTDIDGSDEPRVQVVIEGEEYDTVRGDGELSRGVSFEYSSRFARGEYTFYFKCSDMDPTEPLTDRTSRSHFTVDGEDEKDEDEEGEDDEDTDDGADSQGSDRGDISNSRLIILIVTIVAVIMSLLLLIRMRRRSREMESEGGSDREEADGSDIEGDEIVAKDHDVTDEDIEDWSALSEEDTLDDWDTVPDTGNDEESEMERDENPWEDSKENDDDTIEDWSRNPDEDHQDEWEDSIGDEEF